MIEITSIVLNFTKRLSRLTEFGRECLHEPVLARVPRRVDRGPLGGAIGHCECEVSRREHLSPEASALDRSENELNA